MNYTILELSGHFPNGTIASKELIKRIAEQAQRFGLPIKEYAKDEEVVYQGDRSIIKAGEMS